MGFRDSRGGRRTLLSSLDTSTRSSLCEDDTEIQLLTHFDVPLRVATRWPSPCVILACIAAQVIFMMVYTAILLKALGTGRESYKCPQNLISCT